MWTTNANGQGHFIEIFFNHAIIVTMLKVRLKDNP